MRTGFVRWARSRGSLDGPLLEAVDFWTRFHVIKAALATVMLLGAVAVGRRLARPDALRDRRAGIVAPFDRPTLAGLALLALLVVVANVQGAIAPLASLVGVLPLAAPDPELARALAQLRDAVASGSGAGAVLLEDFRRYHVAMSALAALAALWFVRRVIARMVRRRRTGGPPARSRCALAEPVGALCFGVVAAANLSTALDPVPALQALLAGGS